MRTEVSMHELLVLGAGTAGTIVVNRLRTRLDPNAWRIRVVDRDDQHHYQPGYLRVPFGDVEPQDLVRSRHAQIGEGVEMVTGEVDLIDPVARQVRLEGGHVLSYDTLVIASGTTPRPDQTPGMDGRLWRHSIFDFYTLEGAMALREALETFEGGRLVVHVTEMPIKCPVAPLEFAFLVESWLREHGRRDRVELVYVTPLSGAFTRPVASQRLGDMLAERKIELEGDFMVERIDEDAHSLVSYDGREIPFDLLVTVPVNMGADFVARSGLGDELNYVPVDRHTMQSSAYPDIYAIGDANNLPTSKAGSVAHFSAEVFCDNLVDRIQGRPPRKSYDGHANCFVESGDGKALLIDFNYDVEPLPGRFPLPGVGPLSLLRETRLNHAAKLAFGWVYWNALLPGRPLPFSSEMSMAGKDRTAATAVTTHPEEF